MPKVFEYLFEFLNIQFIDYKNWIDGICNNMEVQNGQIMYQATTREQNLKSTFWALSNITACHNTILDKFLELNEAYGPGQTAFDMLVQNCFLAEQIIQEKTVFIESMFALGNFLTSCSDKHLIMINNDIVVELLVLVLKHQDTILHSANGKRLTLLVLETLDRLFAFDWGNFAYQSDLVSLSKVFQHFEQNDGFNHLSQLALSPENEV